LRDGLISTGNREEHPMYKKILQILWSGKVVGTVPNRAEHKKPKISALQTCVLFDAY
jgi:hypothetical protein